MTDSSGDSKPLLLHGGTAASGPATSSTGHGIFKKRTSNASKRGIWNEKKRAGMSFVIVIAFFAVFIMIILLEIVMVDEKSKAVGVSGHHGIGMAGSYSRLGGEAAPDYEDVKEEYSIEEALYQKNARFIREMRQSRSMYRFFEKDVIL